MNSSLLKVSVNAFIIILMQALSTCRTLMSTGFTTTSTISPSCSKSKVFWTVATKVLVFGKDVKLICKTSSEKHFCTNCTTIWTGGPQLSLISLNGVPRKNSKYLPEKGKDGSGIIVRNFSIQDLNQEYICSIGQNSCKRNLTIEMFDTLTEDMSEGDSSDKFTIIVIAVVVGSIIFIFTIILMCVIQKLKTKKNVFSAVEEIHTLAEPQYLEISETLL